MEEKKGFFDRIHNEGFTWKDSLIGHRTKPSKKARFAMLRVMTGRFLILPRTEVPTEISTPVLRW